MKITKQEVYPMILCLVTLAVAPHKLHSVTPPLRVIQFDTDEGTEMNVDVSPDGKTLVFDLLGHIYTMPIGGGEAVSLMSGSAWDRCPRFSPDGTQISFISDRSGEANLWILDLASKKTRQLTDVTKPIAGVTGTPEWLPSGRDVSYGVINANKFQVSIVSSTGGEPHLLVPDWKRPEDKKSIGAGYSATFTPEGDTAFFSIRYTSATPHAVKKFTDHRLYRLDRNSLTVTRLTEPVVDRDEFKPQLSKSGRLLAYGRSDRLHDTQLRLRDLRTFEDHKLASLFDADEPYSPGRTGDELPAYAFTPDDRFVVIWYQGKLHKVSVEDGSSSIIPFKVHVTRQAAEPVQGHFRISDGPLAVRAIRWPTISRDQKKLFFSAIGSLWGCDLPDCKPRRLTQEDQFEFMPTLSPDGTSLAYVAFPHTEDRVLAPGRLMILDTATNKSRTLTSDTATYYIPHWSVDGMKLAVVRQLDIKDGTTPGKSEFGWVDAITGIFHSVAPAKSFAETDFRAEFGQNIYFSQDGGSLICQRGGPGFDIALYKIGLDGNGGRELVNAGPDVLGIIPSPDLSRIVFIGRNYEAYLTTLLNHNQEPLHVSIESSVLQRIGARQISAGGVLFPNWVDSQTLLYGWMNHIYYYQVGQSHATPLQKIDLEVPRRGGRGVTVFQNARLITVNNEHGAGPIIEHGTIVVRGRRIETLGPVDRIIVPERARIIDASNLTIMPGLVDSHAHGISHGLRNSPLAIPINSEETVQAALAYGITTSWEASGALGDADLSKIELIEAGRLRAQRWFSTVSRIGFWEASFGLRFQTYEEVEEMVWKTINLGAEQCLKDYTGRTRTFAQWFAAAARQSDVCVVTHPMAGTLLSRATDGYMVDHPFLPAPSYQDIVEFLARTGTVWTPTLIAVPVLTPVRAMLEEVRVGKDEKKWQKLERFGVRLLDQLQGTPIVPYQDTWASRIAQVAAAVAAAGGRIAISPDGVHPITNHFEMWALNRGGMSQGDVIRAATRTGAEKLGIQDDVGSLVPGKLADFLVLSANPLDRIENTLSLRYTVLDGVIYNSDTLKVASQDELHAYRCDVKP